MKKSPVFKLVETDKKLTRLEHSALDSIKALAKYRTAELQEDFNACALPEALFAMLVCSDKDSVTPAVVAWLDLMCNETGEA